MKWTKTLIDVINLILMLTCCIFLRIMNIILWSIKFYALKKESARKFARVHQIWNTDSHRNICQYRCNHDPTRVNMIRNTDHLLSTARMSQLLNQVIYLECMFILIVYLTPNEGGTELVFFFNLYSAFVLLTNARSTPAVIHIVQNNKFRVTL